RGVREASLPHHPRGRVVPELVAALVIEPAVVPHGQGDAERRQPLDHDQAREDVPGADRLDACREAGGGAQLRGQRTHVVTGSDARYHSIVRASPSRSVVRATKPKRSSARDTSRRRRGWPFGIDVSHTMSPSKPVSSATSSARSRMEISSLVPRLTGSGPSYRSAARRSPSAQSST